jgi:hypothetical protein
MASPGKHGKMLILAFADSEKAESGGVAEADASYEALINPETYTLEYRVNFSDGGQGQGTSGKQLKYENTEPADMSFEFLFDNTGIIDGQPRESVADDLKTFKELLIGYKGDAHEPRHFKLVWGENSIFKGRVTALAITHKLFNSNGTPVRAVAKVTFKSSVEEKKRAGKEDRKSPDLTQIRKVKLGDTLPQLCFEIYGDPRYYIQVARVNAITNFRRLKPGMDLLFPAIERTRPVS